MKRRRLAMLLFLLSAGSFTFAGALAAELVPLGAAIDLESGAISPRPWLAAAPGQFVVAIDSGCDTPLEIEVYRGAAGLASRLLRRPQVITSPRYEPLLVESLTPTPTGFDLLWYPCVGRQVLYRSHLDLSGKLARPATRLGKADWVWPLGDGVLLAGQARPDLHAIEARLITAAGAPAGPVFPLNSRPVDGPFYPAVLPAADGSFTAIWLATTPHARSTSFLRARRFSPAAEPLGSDFDLDSLAGAPRIFNCCDAAFVVAPAPDGGFAVSWVLGSTLYLRFFDAAATALGPEVPVAAATDVSHPTSMAFDPAGNLLLAWDRWSIEDLRLQLFDRTGQPLGTPIGVGNESLDEQRPRSAQVAWGGDSWLVVWQAGLFPFDQNAVFVRRFADRP